MKLNTAAAYMNIKKQYIFAFYHKQKFIQADICFKAPLLERKRIVFFIQMETSKVARSKEKPSLAAE
ncbi:UNVERIFIED_CONTAM: hypothetical protein NCL1_43289 [Trichonephila clavipes]